MVSASTTKAVNAGISNDHSDDVVLILEDNHVIASGHAKNLRKLGFSNTEIFSSSESANEFLKTAVPKLALLDVDLGEGKTSESTAFRLMEIGVPTVFITGNERMEFPHALASIPVLSKPVTEAEFDTTILRLLE